jgi:hypothetical protein
LQESIIRLILEAFSNEVCEWLAYGFPAREWALSVPVSALALGRAESPRVNNSPRQANTFM